MNRAWMMTIALLVCSGPVRGAEPAPLKVGVTLQRT